MIIFTSIKISQMKAVKDLKILLLYFIGFFLSFFATAQIELNIERVEEFKHLKYYVSYISFSPDGNRVILTRLESKGKKVWGDFMESTKKDSFWSEPTPISLINESKGELDFRSVPTFSADGQTIYFHADFQDSYGGQDIYSSQLTDGVWQSPVNLGPTINSKEVEQSPWVSPDGAKLYFTYGVNDKKNDRLRIYYSEREFDGSWGAPKMWFQNLKFNHTEHPIVFRNNAMILYAMEEKTSDHAIYLSVMRNESDWSVPLTITYNQKQLNKKDQIWSAPRYVTALEKFDKIYLTLDGKIYQSNVTAEMKSLVDNAYQPSNEMFLEAPTASVIAPTTKIGTYESNRTALVIGNSEYSESKLKNPMNDALRISEELAKAGFKVITRTNVELEDMKDAIREFGDELRKNPGVGLFYYAGHGLQNKGVNYLVPLDADIQRQYDIEDECMRADRVLRMMELYDNPMNVIVLDACRNNPYTSQFRSLERGLAQPELAPTGSIIAFATAPGKTASDGDGENGLYTQEFIRSMQIPGLKLEEVFKQTRIRVRERSDKKQNPWENSSLVGDFYFYRK